LQNALNIDSLTLIQGYRNSLASFFLEILKQTTKNEAIIKSWIRKNSRKKFAKIQMIKKSMPVLFPSSAEFIHKIDEQSNITAVSAWSFIENLVKNSAEHEKTQESIEVLIYHCTQWLLKNQDSWQLVSNPKELHKIVLNEFPEFEILSEVILKIAEIIPALSEKADSYLPNLRAVFFEAYDLLKAPQAEALGELAQSITYLAIDNKLNTYLEKRHKQDEKFKVISSILLEFCSIINGEDAFKVAVECACTPKGELTEAKILTICLNQLGGLYLKFGQLISEICPPHMAKELRNTQDKASSLATTIEKSWKIVWQQISHSEHESLFKFLNVSEFSNLPQFAAASMGAIYEIQLNDSGKKEFNEKSILIKVQRPNLKNKLKQQNQKIQEIFDSVIEKASSGASGKNNPEILSLLISLKKTLNTYFEQSFLELDFRKEGENALKISKCISEYVNFSNSKIQLPIYYYSSKQLVAMQRMPGTKVTRIAQTRYLERREIADTILSSYLSFVFESNIVWADPHPGNILYDPVCKSVSMIDLNPSFVWDNDLKIAFKKLIYRLFLRDAAGIYECLYLVVENPNSLHANNVYDSIKKFLSIRDHHSANKTPGHFSAEFLKTLNQNNVSLKIEVLAALRGILQVALTANSVSVRNSFSQVLRKHLGLNEFFKVAWELGTIKTVRVLLFTIYDLIQNIPQEDVGPSVDERDIKRLQRRVLQLASAGVCHIDIVRVSPEEHTELTLASDESSILVSSCLKIEVIDATRPADVRYKVLVPTEVYLKLRQEYVKLMSLARVFCLVECLEELRRSSLDLYWKTVDSWNKPTSQRTVLENILLCELKVSSRELVTAKFSRIWDSHSQSWITGKKNIVKPRKKFYWLWLLRLEHRRDKAEFNFFRSKKRKFGQTTLASLALSGVFKLNFLILELLISQCRKQIKKSKYSMHLLPMSAVELESMILNNLSRRGQTNA
jgi:ubiquinone biosynthesis protein